MDARATPADPTHEDLERLLSHAEWLRALARRLVRDAATAEDLVQDTWIAALKSPPDPGRPVRPWLAGVARRLARMRARTEGRRTRRQTVAARRDELPSTAELIEGVDTQRRLAEVVLELSEPYRTTVLLRYFHDLSAAEISRRQGVPAGTVRWRLKRGLDELRERLDRRWGGRRSWCLAFTVLVESGESIGVPAAWAAVLGSLWLRAAAAGALVAALVLIGVRALRPDGARSLPAPARVADVAALGPRLPGEAPVATGAGRASVSPPGAAAPAEGPAPLALTLLESDGESAQGLRAVLVDRLGAGRVAVSDRDGVLRFEPGAGPGTLYVERRSAFVHCQEIELAAGETELRLPSGLALAGRVLIDGAPPEEPITLELDYDTRIFDGREPPPPVRDELGVCRRTSATTDAAGAFAFRALDPGWSGEMWVPPGYVFAGHRSRAQGASLHVRGPQVGLVVEVERLPRVTGRVIGADGRTPVAGAQLLLRAFGGGGPDDEAEGSTGEDGRFDLPLDFADPLGLVLEARSPGIQARWERRLDGSTDLGDLRAEERANVTLSVRDAAGTPIPGAVARYSDSEIVHGPSADGGLLEVPARDGGASLTVGAPGWHTVEILPGSPSFQVVLEPANRLGLTVLDVEGRPMARAPVRVRAPNEPFADERRGGVAKPSTDAAGALVLEGVVPGLPLRVEVLDALREPVLDRELAPLGARERRAVTLRLERRLFTLRGTCTDEDGDVLVGALVFAGGPGGRAAKIRSGLLGDFEIDRIGRPVVRLEARKRGFATRVFEQFPVPPDGEPVRIALAPGHDLAVRVLDDSGAPVEGGRVSARDAAGVTWEGAERAPGQFLVHDLPAGELRVVLELAGREYAVAHDPLDPELEIRTPVHGRVAVRWTLPDGRGDPDLRWRVSLRLPREAEEPLLTRALGAGVGEGETLFPAVPPGRYDARLEWTTGRGSEARYAPFGEPVTVDVTAAAAAAVELR